LSKFLIVGQGLAGSVLAYFLLEKEQEVQILNSSIVPSSSKVAAGIYNPVTGKRLAKTWLADELFPFLEDFYQSIEDKLNARFLHKIPIYRPFANIEQQNFFTAKTVEISQYISTETDHDVFAKVVKNDLGGLITKQSGWVDLPVFLASMQGFFREKRIFREEEFDLALLKNSTTKLMYKGEKFDKIIFCEGTHATQNPLWNWLPFDPVKGEILDIQIPNSDLNSIVNQGVFVMPQTNGQAHTFRVGSTYSWHEFTWQSTPQATQFLTEKLEKFLKVPYQITDQRAGIRPAVKDRRPILGLHPNNANLAIFNGLGTKGVSLAPYFGQMMADFLIHNKAIIADVSIQRFLG
jgi:glycine/D-amino acid oxidase-like deaminating enzyme